MKWAVIIYKSYDPVSYAFGYTQNCDVKYTKSFVWRHYKVYV
jgi:hypothetical protein